MELLNNAFHSLAEWQAFKTGVGGGVGVQAWVQQYDKAICAQTSRRDRLPDHHSTGALDEALAKVREFAEPRAFCYRNAERTNRMLELVRLRLNKADDPGVYAAAIRAHLASTGSRLPSQGGVRDPLGTYSLRA